MKKQILSLFLLIIFGINFIFAQTNSDSVVLNLSTWNIDTLTPHLVLKRLSIQNKSLFNSNQNISILEIDTAQSSLRMEFIYSDTLTRTSSFCKKNKAFAAINGTFFFMKSGKSTDYIRIHGRKIADNVPKEGKRKSYKNGLLALFDKSPQLSIILPDTNLFFEDSLAQQSVLTAGPMLLFADSILPYIQNSFSLSRHPRTGVGITHDNKILWVVVDGHSSHAAGMSLKEFAYTMKYLDVATLLNLDGGGSSTLYINDGKHGMINFPSDNGKFDHYGERRVASAVLLFLE